MTTELKKNDMKVVILAGGLGTRISEESHLRPKPMIEIGERPILWHIMKIYSSYGFNNFLICLGYKGYFIKEYFANYMLHESSITFDFSHGEQKTIVHHNKMEPWTVTLVDTGAETMTGGRVKRLKDYIKDQPFMLTYGDGLSDVNITKLAEYHLQHGKLCTVTAVQPTGRFGIMGIAQDNKVTGFQEKPKGDGTWVNGGYFVMQPQVLDYIENDQIILEREPLENLAKAQQLVSFKHEGFWQPMDTLRDKVYLESLWKEKKAPWKLWK